MHTILSWRWACIALLLLPWRLPAAETATADAIDGWIKQLDDDDYTTRERASQCLTAAGAPAIGPLTKAASGESLEATYRALHILGQLCDTEGNVPVSDAAEAALLALRDTTGPGAPIAREILLHHSVVQQRWAAAEIQRLGGHIRNDPLSSETQVQVILDEDWRGGAAGLKNLTKLGHFEQLCIWMITLDDDAIKVLSDLRSVDKIQLYGTGVTEKQSQQLAASANATIDLRAGGLLGVQGSPGALGGCRVNGVQEGSAADKAGITVGDVIVKFDGIDIHDFDALTREISKRKPGERVRMVVNRGEPSNVFTVDVTLGRWHKKFAP